jgi:pimeloyl-ACP methyl ester carboxylesterase
MQLEVIARTPNGKARSTPLLFVHGAFAGAWVWESHFLPFFAGHGYPAYALSLRGHGNSDGSDGLMFARLQDYVADVERVVAGLDRPPVLIGHSMGGVVVQKYLRRHPLPAAVLLASGPPHGVIGCCLNMLFNHPQLLWHLAWLQTVGPLGVDMDLIRRALFSAETSDAEFTRMLPRMHAESAMVLLDLWGLDLPPSTPVAAPPVLVLGAENDAFIYRGALEATAWTYRTKPEIFGGMGHAMMLDHHWQTVAARILRWLDDTLPAADAAAVRAAA